MNSNKKLLCVLLSVLFLTVPMGIAAFSPSGSTTTIADASIPATDYDFTNRREPISILVFNQFSDNAGAGEWDHTMGELKAEYGYTFEYDNLTDYTELETRIVEYDVLLLVEQELATYAQMDTVAAAWDGFIGGWVDDGGIVICMDHWSTSEIAYHPTARILNNTGLMRIYNSTARIGASITITNSFDPLAFGVSAYTGPSGSSSFDTPDGDTIFSTGGQTVVAHRYMGLGHVVMLGFDMYNIDPNPRTILANAVRLTRLAVFDNSHYQTSNPNSGFNNFANEIQQNYGFAIATMNTWDESLIEICDVLVAGNGVAPIPYSSVEIDFVKGFVAGGGGLLIATDWGRWGNNTVSLLGGFGFARNSSGSVVFDSDENGGDPSQPIYGVGNIANHSTTFGVSTIQMYYGSAFTTIPAAAKPLILTDSDGTEGWAGGGLAAGLAVAASLIYGAGRVIALTDGDFLADINWDGDATPDFFDENNEVFVTGMMNWLSAAGIPEKTVLFDNSNTPAVSLASFNVFATFLTLNGYNFIWMNQFHESLVSQADILILPDGVTNFTIPEISVIVDFVSRGGGLFVLADHTVHCEQVNPVVFEFGLQYNETGGAITESDDFISAGTYVIHDGDNLANHPIMTGVERIELDLNGGFVTVGAGTALVSTDTDGTASWSAGGLAIGVPVIAATTFGMGRVVAVADYNLPLSSDYDSDNYGNIYDSDNDVFLANAFYWLIENRAPIVDVVFPNGGEILNVTQFIEWTAVDPNRDELTFELFISDNNGSDWTSLTSGLTGFAWSWNTTLHDDSNSYMIRVVASDGMLTGQDESDDPFTLDNFDELPPPGEPFDPTLIAIIGAGVLVVVIILVILMKRGGGGKK